MYKRVRAKRDASEVGPKGPDTIDALQGEQEAGGDNVLVFFSV